MSMDSSTMTAENRSNGKGIVVKSSVAPQQTTQGYGMDWNRSDTELDISI